MVMHYTTTIPVFLAGQSVAATPPSSTERLEDGCCSLENGSSCPILQKVAHFPAVNAFE
jgi:hypothetical protein